MKLLILLFAPILLLAQTPTPTCTISSGTLPPGITLNGDGTLTGKPTIAGSYLFTIKCTANNAEEATKEFSIIINPPWIVKIETISLPMGRVNVDYNADISVTVTLEVGNNFDIEKQKCVAHYLINPLLTRPIESGGLVETDESAYKECIENLSQG